MVCPHKHFNPQNCNKSLTIKDPNIFTTKYISKYLWIPMNYFNEITCGRTVRKVLGSQLDHNNGGYYIGICVTITQTAWQYGFTYL